MLNFALWGGRRVPFVAASELNECGLACLAAISGYFDGEPGLADMRRMAVPSGRGETLLELRNLAEKIGLAARGVMVGVEALKQLAVPAILHWDMNHFVVLERNPVLPARPGEWACCYGLIRTPKNNTTWADGVSVPTVVLSSTRR